jgi:hypothetical protein
MFLTPEAFGVDDLGALAGKWSVQKTNEQGDKYTQTLEIKKDKFVFQILDGDNQLTLYAEGDIKLEKLASFSSIRFFHIRAGSSAASLKEIDDEYDSIYVLDADTWIMASNFDKQREQQKPSADTYRRIKAPVPAKPAKSA